MFQLSASERMRVLVSEDEPLIAVLRLTALDRRRAYHRAPVREIAGPRLDPFRREVQRDGRDVALTRKLGEPWIIASVAGVGYRIDSQQDSEPEGGYRG